MFPPLLVGALVSGAATVGSLVQYYRRQLGALTLADVRALETLAPTPIAHAQRGLVKIVGTVGCETPVPSLYGSGYTPLAAREVRHYDVVATKAGARRVLARVERAGHAFWIEDDTGRLPIDPEKVRIDYEVEGADTESLLEEHRLRVGERVAVIGVVRREASLGAHPLRRSARHMDQALVFEQPPVVTWRTEPEVYPRMLPPAGGVALSAGTIGMAILGAILS